MAADNKIRRPVSFNKTKEADMELMKFIGRKNFSGYVKKLIREDMARKAEERRDEDSGGKEWEFPEKKGETETERIFNKASNRLVEQEIGREGVGGVDGSRIKKEPSQRGEKARQRDDSIQEGEGIQKDATVENRLHRLREKIEKHQDSLPKVFVGAHLKK